DAEVDAGRFRQDLLFRLNVHVLRVPPLRERLSDLPELATHLVSSICARYGIPARRLSPDALARLATHDWRRNNVRELRNVIE
ncbi:AAA-type ATPase lid domain-containing protein, partial [Streptococcus pyogenes]